MSWYRYDDANNLVLTLHIQTGAKNTEAAGLHGDALRIKLAAAPVEGKANAALLKFLAKHFDVPLSQVILRQGDKSRHKVIIIQQPGCGPDAIYKELQS
ncbi:MAG: YggU family protein [Nitrosomonas sp.]|nr:YggU family protein [Nitrosomonas sp.]